MFHYRPGAAQKTGAAQALSGLQRASACAGTLLAAAAPCAPGRAVAAVCLEKLLRPQTRVQSFMTTPSCSCTWWERPLTWQ